MAATLQGEECLHHGPKAGTADEEGALRPKAGTEDARGLSTKTAGLLPGGAVGSWHVEALPFRLVVVPRARCARPLSHA